MNPLVSILIPVYNRVNLVSQTIESAINQTYHNIEIIIVDNCSTDGTWELLNEFAQKDERIRLFQNEENIGPVRNWKRCLDEAKGDYSKILFSDDLISENWIMETLKILDKDVAFVLTEIVVFKDKLSLKTNNSNSESHFSELSTEIYLNNILLFNEMNFSVSPGCALFRTNDITKSLEIEIDNPLDLKFEVYGAGNDLLLFLNTCINYPKIRIAKHPISFFRSHNGSFTISNKLNVYYDFSKYYFVKKFLPEMLSKLKAVLWSRKIREKNDSLVYNLIDTKISWYIFLKHFLSIRKISN